MAWNKTYVQVLEDDKAYRPISYSEWLSKEPEREAARKSAKAEYSARLDAREARLKALAASAVTAEQAMTQLHTAYLADDSYYEQDFVEEFRAVLQAWENGQKAVR